jgi:hypothetical protein
MKLFKIKNNELFTQLIIFVFVLLIFLFSISKSLNHPDFPVYANNLEKSFATKNILLPFQTFGAYSTEAIGGLSKNSFYIILSYPYTFLFSHLLRLDIEFVLNSFSSICVALGAVFIYKLGMLLFDQKKSFLAVALYVLMPYIFFNGINATCYSLQLPLTAIWLYFMILGIKKKVVRYGMYSSLFLLMNVFTHLSSAPLILAHLFGLYKIKKKPSWIALNLLILIPAAVVVFYFSFINKAYPMEFNLMKIIFTSLLAAWENINGISILMSASVIISVFYILRKIYLKKFDEIDVMFILSLIGALPGLLAFTYGPIFGFTSIYIFLPIIVIRTFKDWKYFNILALLIIIFMIVKIAPIYYQFHFFPHPHKEYSFWLSKEVGNNIVLVGHECPWVGYYTNLTFFCRGHSNITIPTDQEVFVTSQYFKSENQMDLEYMNDIFNTSIGNNALSAIYRFDLIPNRTMVKVTEYPFKTRDMEDAFQWFFSVYPNPFLNVFINTKFLKPDYIIYKLV